MRKILAMTLTLALTAHTSAAPVARSKARPKPIITQTRKPAVETAMAPLAESPELAQLRAGFQFAFPVYEMMRVRANTLTKAQAAGISGINRFFPRTTLADSNAREVTTPNNDTLYSSAWIDLSAGPLTLSIPALPRRYHSVALMDLFTDNTAILGTRLGGIGGKVTIVGPDWTGALPEGVPVVRSLTNDAWMLVRVLVNGPDDLTAAAAAIGDFKLDTSLSGKAVPTRIVPTLLPDAATLLATVNDALGRGGLAPGDAARMAKFADLGIFAGDVDAFSKLSPEVQKLWNRALPQLRAELRGGLTNGEAINGWHYSAANTGLFGDDDLTRARVALGGLAALPRQEAIYITARSDSDGKPFNAANQSYVLQLPGNLPIGGFWSLTLYTPEKDGRLFFYDTPTRRYTINDRTKFLHANRDGGIELFIQNGKPYGERAVNWLPAPAGPFVLVFRAYLPKQPLIDGSFSLPGVEAAEPIPSTAPKE